MNEWMNKKVKIVIHFLVISSTDDSPKKYSGLLLHILN